MAVDLKLALSNDFKTLFNSLEKIDDYNVTIKVGQNSFKAHSVILKARSKYFQNYINIELKKRFKRNIITLEISNISPSVFKVCLEYIYTGEFFLQEHSNEFMFDLIVAADNLSLVDMVEYLQNYFLNKKTSWIEQNIIKVYQTSKSRQELTGLQNYCKALMDKDPALFFNSTFFPTLQKEILIDLIRRDDLSLLEVTIWRNVIKWGVEQEPSINKEFEKWSQSDFDELGSRIKDLVPHIRFFTIPSDKYHFDVRPYKEAIPKIIIEQLEKFYNVKGTPAPKDALLPRKLKRNNSKLRNKTSEVNMKRNNNGGKQPPAENIPDPIDIIAMKPLNLDIDTNHDIVYTQQDLDSPLKTSSVFTAPRTPSPSPSENTTIVVTPRTSSPFPSDNESQSKIVDFKDFTFDSILIGKAQIRRISRWIDGFDNGMDNNPNKNFFLLARGSRDGMTREIFHSLCDNKGPTIVLAKVEGTQDIIGGYNPKSWSSSNKWIKTNESFIFSFKSDGNREGIDDIILSRVRNIDAAIWDGNNKYDVGFSSDLQLFNGEYKCEHYNRCIMDSNNFKIMDYEVFQVKKKKILKP